MSLFKGCEYVLGGKWDGKCLVYLWGDRNKDNILEMIDCGSIRVGRGKKIRKISIYDGLDVTITET